MIRAYEFQARHKAGLALVGRNEEGEYEWMGTDKQFKKADNLSFDMRPKCNKCKGVGMFKANNINGAVVCGNCYGRGFIEWKQHYA